MATSGTTSFSSTRNQLLTDALYDAGIVAIGQAIDDDIMAFAARKLNMMLKAWQADGLHLWKLRETTLFLEEDDNTYTLGPSGQHATESYTETAIKTTAVAGATSIDVDSTTGMTASDYICIILDSGDAHWTTISSITDSDTVVIASGIPTGDSAAVDNVVYFYTTKAPRPLAITDAVLRDIDDNDIPVTLISRSEYYNFGDKTTTGTTPTQFWFNPSLTNANLKVYPTPSNGKYRLVYTGEYQIEDVTSANNDFDCPQEWLLAIQTNVAVLLTPSYGSNSTEFKKLKLIADEEKERVMGWDKEKTSMFIQPATHGR